MSTSAERGRKLREKRKQQGLCAQCGKENDRFVHGKQSCSFCAKRTKGYKKKKGYDYYKNHYDNLKERNVCFSCKAPLDREGTYCRKCANAMKEEAKKTVQKRKQLKVCIHCQKSLDRKGVLCQTCAKNKREAVQTKVIEQLKTKYGITGRIYKSKDVQRLFGINQYQVSTLEKKGIVKPIITDTNRRIFTERDLAEIKNTIRRF